MKATREQILSKVGDLGFKRRVNRILDWLTVKNSDVILDCGCGEGFYTMTLVELYDDFKVTAFDQNATLLKMAANWAKNHSHKIEFINGDIEKGLPFPNDFFDKIIFTEVLEHLDHDHAALTELYRVLKPGGIVALTVPNENFPFLWDPLNGVRKFLKLGHFDSKNTVLGGVWAYDHKRLYSVNMIRNLCEITGFKVQEQLIFTHYCMPFNYLILRLGKMLTMAISSQKIKSSMEKFEWKDSERSKDISLFAKFTMFILNFFKKIDIKNNDIEKKLKYSSVSIGLLLKK
jgi:ubiquinone/menaquinone biosynthesis C-methylase UbiE